MFETGIEVRLINGHNNFINATLCDWLFVIRNVKFLDPQSFIFWCLVK